MYEPNANVNALASSGEWGGDLLRTAIIWLVAIGVLARHLLAAISHERQLRSAAPYL